MADMAFLQEVILTQYTIQQIKPANPARILSDGMGTTKKQFKIHIASPTL